MPRNKPLKGHAGLSVAIIGAGKVGGAVAFALILSLHLRELLLVDTNAEVAEGQAHDLSDAALGCNSHTHICRATHREAAQCDIIIITAGAKFTIGQTTIDLTYRNLSLVRSIIDAMRPINPDAILLLVSNPVDLLTTIAQDFSGLPATQVIGSGTFLDSIRIRGLVAEHAKIAPQSVNLYVLGVHGDAQVVAWSRGSIGANRINELVPDHKSLELDCKHRSQHIIRAKGATPFGIASVVTSICSSIVLDKRNVRAVSHYQPKLGCCLSMPAAIGRRGIIKTLNMSLSSEEGETVTESAIALRGTVQRVREVL